MLDNNRLILLINDHGNFLLISEYLIIYLIPRRSVVFFALNTPNYQKNALLSASRNYSDNL